MGELFGVAGAFGVGGVEGEQEVAFFGAVAAEDIMHPVAGAAAGGGEEGFFAEGFVPEFGVEFGVAEVVGVGDEEVSQGERNWGG